MNHAATHDPKTGETLPDEPAPRVRHPLMWQVSVAGGVLAAVVLAGFSLWTLVVAGDRPAAIGGAGWLWTASLAAGALSLMAAGGQRLGLWGLRVFFLLAGAPMVTGGLRDHGTWLFVGAGLCAAWLVLSLFARPAEVEPAAGDAR
ncbi:hypothetical protein Pla163_32060 [Planctomycetes bacterium Pla163]|uniref:Uncharacterized protein n=1 Tax=Rohdeia mirabilis TaxID=2528008 RepID=A0A518D3K2_9BACT|nr:hypothetical protein Pla163_32060 [Planctomycetes bacterium Pla163]